MWPVQEVVELKEKVLEATAAAGREIAKQKAALTAEAIRRQEEWEEELAKLKGKEEYLQAQ